MKDFVKLISELKQMPIIQKTSVAMGHYVAHCNSANKLQSLIMNEVLSSPVLVSEASSFEYMNPLFPFSLRFKGCR
jgi:hypothetical protein